MNDNERDEAPDGFDDLPDDRKASWEAQIASLRTIEGRLGAEDLDEWREHSA